MVLIKEHPGGQTYELDSCGMSLAELKGLLYVMCDVEPYQQKLVFRGKVLDDDECMLDSLGVTEKSTMILVRSKSQQQQQQQQRQQEQPVETPIRPTATVTTTFTSRPPAPRRPQQQQQPQLTPIPMPQFLSSNTPTSQQQQQQQQQQPAVNSFQDMQQQMQQQLMGNPDLMSQMLNSPMMQGIMENPEIMQQMFMNNPQIQQVLNDNPELRHALNDPEVFRQNLELARNPQLMREMMRNTDRALSNIESMPGGYNALRRMYHSVQEPMMEAAMGMGMNMMSPSSSNAGPTDANASPNAPRTATPVDAPLPNPWAPTRQPRFPSAPMPNNNYNAFYRPNPFPPRPPATSATTNGGTSPSPAVSSSNYMSTMNSLTNNNAETIQHMARNDPRLASNPAAMQMLQDPNFISLMNDPAVMDAIVGANRRGLDGVELLHQTIRNRYREKLDDLKSMGFEDEDLNLHALMTHGGDLEQAIEWLFQQQSQPQSQSQAP